MRLRRGERTQCSSYVLRSIVTTRVGDDDRDDDGDDGGDDGGDRLASTGGGADAAENDRRRRVLLMSPSSSSRRGVCARGKGCERKIVSKQ